LHTRDKDGSRYLEARLERNGDLIIEGQDLGDGVERWFAPASASTNGPGR
jgi:hypothetical protein